jgi:hypothetical protein
MGVAGARYLKSNLGPALQEWRAERAVLKEKLSQPKQNVVKGVDNEIELILKEANKAETEAGLVAVKFVEEHPNVVKGKNPGEREAKVGDHKIKEVREPRTGVIHCEYHSDGGTEVPCPTGMGTVEEFLERRGKPLERAKAVEPKKQVTAAPKSEPTLPEGFEEMPQITLKPSPRREPRQFLRGNFAHRFYEHIRHLTGVKLEKEVVIALRDGTGDIIRADRIIRHSDQGLLLEIKPKGRFAERGRAQLPGRLKALQREFPKKNGWIGKVVEYDRSDVEAWLLAEARAARAERRPVPNVSKLMKELGF